MNASPTPTRTLASTRRRGAAVLAALSLTGGLLATVQAVAPAAAAEPVGPPYPVAQPAEAEGFTAYVPQISCDPVAKAGVKKFRTLMLDFYKRGGVGNIERNCASGSSEHWDGRAWDWMLNYSNSADRAVATKALNWLLAPGSDGTPAVRARRLGIMYVIWDAKIWSAYRAGDGWRAYRGSSPHRDHIHFSFSWQGARGVTSFWDGTVAKIDYGPCRAHDGDPGVLWTGANPSRCPDPAPRLYDVTRSRVWLGSRNADVSAAQRLLRTKVTGFFGTTTQRAVMNYQRARDLPVTGVMDTTTWGQLDRASVKPGSEGPRDAPAGVRYAKGMAGHDITALQTKLGMLMRYRTGYFGNRTRGYVLDFQRTRDLPATGTVGERTWEALTPRTTRALREGMRGDDVRLLQTRLGMPTSQRTGYFGAATKQAVLDFQTAHRLSGGGVAWASTRAWLGM